MTNAAMYLRSSKDRSDVSISSQRRELTALARRQGLTVVAEYSDTVESAKDEFRPQFQTLLQDLRGSDRNWSVLLAIDTSRISRRTYFAHAFRHEAKKRGVEVRYAKMPEEMDPITEVIVYSTMTAMDEVHSLMSREKGLAGMAENVRSGWRAGGRAPFGYRLASVGVGTVRDGREVTKTRLEPEQPQASQAQRYLSARAEGATRRAAIEASGIERSTSTLIGMEWNALTYAGATVWNVHAEKLPEGGYRGGAKRRPRNEWIIQHDTHEALIEKNDAEALIERLENSDTGRRVSEAKSGNSSYLLSGLLVTPDGQPWYGHKRRQYRYRPDAGSRGRYVNCADVDNLVLQQLASDIGGEEFAAAMAEAARESAQTDTTDIQQLRAQIDQVNARIDRAMELAEKMEDPAPALRRVDGLERERKALAEAITRAEEQQRQQSTLASITDKEIRAALETVSNALAETEREKLKPELRGFIDRVTLDPASLETTIHYRMTVDQWPCMASPRRPDSLPPILLAVVAGKAA